MNIHSDFLVIGGGMAGASAAYFLSRIGKTAVLEMESQPGVGTTVTFDLPLSREHDDSTLSQSADESQTAKLAIRADSRVQETT